MKLKGYFFILAALLLTVFAIFFFANIKLLLWQSIIFFLILFILIYLVFFYRKVVRSLQSIGSGMDLLKEQDFSSRLRKVGQFEADKVVAIFNKMMDELKNERLKLREQNEFLDLLIKASPMGVIVLNFDEQIMEMNPSALKITGIKDILSVKGKKMTEAKELMQIDLTKIPMHETRTVNLFDGAVYKCTLESFIDRGFPRPFYLIEGMTEEVRRAEKKAYEKVIRMISHEVNNTTAGITSTLDTVEKELVAFPDSDDMREAMKVCINRCYGMSKFIVNFADVVKIPKAQLVQTDLNKTISSLIRFMEVMCSSRKIGIHFQPDKYFPIVPIDAGLFDQAILNIIKNAAESIEREGDIFISTIAETQTLEVADTGKGISKETESKLFSPFFSTKSTGQGIGLLFVREVLVQHHCTFSLRTYPDGLTKFIIQFS